MTVERGDHIVPSFQEWAGRAQLQQGDAARRRWVGEDDISALQWLLCCRPETGRAYYLAAMQSHGLPGKIPNSFTTGIYLHHRYMSSHATFVILCCSGEAFLREHPVQLPHRGVQRRDRGGDGQDYEYIGGGGKININN